MVDPKTRADYRAAPTFICLNVASGEQCQDVLSPGAAHVEKERPRVITSAPGVHIGQRMSEPVKEQVVDRRQ
jgi:hypothetical protein